MREGLSELHPRLVDVVVHSARRANAIEVFRSATDKRALKLVDFAAALPPLERQLDPRALRAEDQATQRRERLAENLCRQEARRRSGGSSSPAGAAGRRRMLAAAARLAVVDGKDHVAHAHGALALRRAAAHDSLDVDAAVGLLLEKDAHAGLHCAAQRPSSAPAGRRRARRVAPAASRAAAARQRVWSRRACVEQATPPDSLRRATTASRPDPPSPAGSREAYMAAAWPWRLRRSARCDDGERVLPSVARSVF